MIYVIIKPQISKNLVSFKCEFIFFFFRKKVSADMDANKIKEFIVAYYTVLFNNQLDLSKFYAENAILCRNPSKPEGIRINPRKHILAIPKNFSLTILHYSYVLIDNNRASVFVNSSIDPISDQEGKRFFLCQSFILSENTTKNTIEIISDQRYTIFADEKVKSICTIPNASTTNTKPQSKKETKPQPNTETNNGTNSQQKQETKPNNQRKQMIDKFVYIPDNEKQNDNSGNESKTGADHSNDNQPKPAKNQPKSSNDQPKSANNQPKSTNNQPNSTNNQPKSGEDQNEKSKPKKGRNNPFIYIPNNDTPKQQPKPEKEPQNEVKQKPSNNTQEKAPTIQNSNEEKPQSGKNPETKTKQNPQTKKSPKQQNNKFVYVPPNNS